MAKAKTIETAMRPFVDFLRTELDRVGPAHADLCRDFFSRAAALELSFFEAAYAT
jgi:thiaminase (transcriptional activator TenA)